MTGSSPFVVPCLPESEGPTAARAIDLEDGSKIDRPPCVAAVAPSGSDRQRIASRMLDLPRADANPATRGKRVPEP
jgi:hypothetical protein